MANQLTIRTNDEVDRSSARTWILAVAAAAGSQALAFPAAAQDGLPTACRECGEQCGNPIFYPEDGSCPNPILYPESMIAIGAALVLGFLLGAGAVRMANKKQGMPNR